MQYLKHGTGSMLGSSYNNEIFWIVGKSMIGPAIYFYPYRNYFPVSEELKTSYLMLERTS